MATRWQQSERRLSQQSTDTNIIVFIYFHQRSSFIKGRPPSQVIFHQSYVQYKPPHLPISNPNGKHLAAGTIAHARSSVMDSFFFGCPQNGQQGLEMVHPWVIRGGEQLSLNSFFDLSSTFFFNLPQLSPSLLDSQNYFLCPKWPTGSGQGAPLGYLTLRTTSAKQVFTVCVSTLQYTF